MNTQELASPVHTPAPTEGQPGTFLDAASLVGLVIRGETYPFRDLLRSGGFRWDDSRKEWSMGEDWTEESGRVARLLYALRDHAIKDRSRWLAASGFTGDRVFAYPDDLGRDHYPAAFLQIGYY